MNYYKNLINYVWLYFKNMYMNMGINSDIENQVSKKEKCKNKFFSFMEKHSLCVVGCWLVFLLIMSISISEYYKK